MKKRMGFTNFRQEKLCNNDGPTVNSALCYSFYD